jgi:hypothetical protein
MAKQQRNVKSWMLMALNMKIMVLLEQSSSGTVVTAYPTILYFVILQNNNTYLYLPGETLSLISVMHTSRCRPWPSGVEPARLMLHGCRICNRNASCKLIIQTEMLI